jgi:poly [ADP-ribose] polymerase 2/3/4
LSLVESLCEIEVAVKLLGQCSPPPNINPLDATLAQMNLHISDAGAEEASLVRLYAQRTHGGTHTWGVTKGGVSTLRFLFIERSCVSVHRPSIFSSVTPQLDVEDVWVVSRGETEPAFAPFGEAKRMLLWHGSRLSNFAGILSQASLPPPRSLLAGPTHCSSGGSRQRLHVWQRGNGRGGGGGC